MLKNDHDLPPQKLPKTKATFFLKHTGELRIIIIRRKKQQWQTIHQSSEISKVEAITNG